MKIVWLVILLPLISSCAVTRLLNSGTVNIKYRAVEATFEDEKYEISEHVTNPSFSIRNVQHPRAWGKWNLNLRLTPSLHYDDNTYQTGATFINTETGLEQTRPNINVRRGIILANLKTTLHTPIGAFALSGGFGGTMYRLDDGQGLNTIKTREIRRIDFAWYAFFTKRFFVLMGPRYYKAGYETYEFAFRIGYFWGRIEK